MLARALDFGVGRIVSREQVAPLQGKRFALVVRDLGLAMHVESTPAGFRVARAPYVPDLTVAATLSDFIALARREAARFIASVAFDRMAGTGSLLAGVKE